MAFEVETGTGSPTANAYAAVATADAYWADRGSPSAWTSATTAAKQAALVAASEYFDETFGERYRGCETNEDQRMRWPRYGDLDARGRELVEDEIPEALQEATIELALEAARGALRIDSTTAPTETVIETSSKLEGLEKSRKLDVSGGAQTLIAGTRKRFPAAEAKLAVLLTGGGPGWAVGR